MAFERSMQPQNAENDFEELDGEEAMAAGVTGWTQIFPSGWTQLFKNYLEDVVNKVGHEVNTDVLDSLPQKKGTAFALFYENESLHARVWNNKKTKAYELQMQKLNSPVYIVEVLDGENLVNILT